MKKLITSLLIGIIISSFASVEIFAAESSNDEGSYSRQMDYQQINSMLRHIKYKTSSPFVEVKQMVTIKNENDTNELTLKDIRLWIEKDGEILHEIPIDEAGNIQLPIIDEDIVKAVKLNTNQPPKTTTLSIELGVKVPKEKEVPYRDLFVLLKDTNDFISEMAGSFSWLAPSMDELSFTFDQAATIVIKSKRKTYEYKTDDEFKIGISFKRRLMKENPMVVFSHLPTEMSPED